MNSPGFLIGFTCVFAEKTSAGLSLNATRFVDNLTPVVEQACLRSKP